MDKSSTATVYEASATGEAPAERASGEIARLVGVMDRSLDGKTAEETRRERALSDEARRLDAEIARLLASAGTSRTAVGPDTLPALEREMARAQAEQSELEADAQETARRLAEAHAEIARLDSAIEGAKGMRQELGWQIERLERDIQDRTIIEDAWYLFFKDDKKAELKTTREKRESVQNDIDASLHEIHEKKRLRDGLTQAAAGLASRKADADAAIRACQTRQDALRKAIAAAKANEASLASLASLREAFQRRAAERASEWNAAAKALRKCVEEARGRQPRLETLGPEGFGGASAFPAWFSAGRCRLAGGGGEWDVPRLLPFPLPQAIRFSGGAAKDGIREFLLRAFQCLPPEFLEITVCDPVKMGASLGGFTELLANRKPFPERRFLTGAREIEDALARLHGEIDSFIQRDCTGEIGDWESYNAAHPGRPRVYRLLAMFDLPDQLSDAAAGYLAKIVANGPECGILPLLECDADALDPRRHAVLREALLGCAADAWRLGESLCGYSGFRNIRVAGEAPCAIPGAARLADALSGLREGYARRDKFAGALETLWEEEPLWGASSADGLEAPVGWREDDRSTLVVFSVGRRGHSVFHALLGGKTGSGKSNLIHVLLHSLCHRYSPEELNLYMLDYKEAVEFNSYTNPLLPHAAGIATESDVEYGLSVLHHLSGEMERRAEAFKAADVPNIYEYRMKTGRPMARILLVVDEFQRLFETAKDGEAAEAMLGKLVRQGRSAGIHLLLATQTLSGLRNLASARSLVSQISCRIALACIPEDSATLLQSDNLEAATLDSPPQGIYNDNLGVKSANVKFIIPEAVAETRRRHLEMLHGAAAGRSVATPDCRVFDGTALPAMPPREFFEEAGAAASGPYLPVGRMADFGEAPVVAGMAGRNMLVVGRQKGIDGVKEAIAEGLRAAPGRKAFLIYTERPELWVALEGPGSEVVPVDDEWNCGNLDEFAAGDAERKVIVLDGFENLRALRAVGFVSSRNGPSAAERLRTLVERPAKSGVQLVVCFRDYGRALSAAKDLLAMCDVRIGDASLSDPAKFAAFDSAGSHDAPVPRGSKAILADRDADGPILFRPFAPKAPALTR